MALRLVFMGTPDFSVPTLAALVDAGHEVAAVYSQPPRPAGRGMAERKSPVHTWAEAAGLRVATPRSLKGEAEQRAFAGLSCDAAVVVAYGLILPKAVLEAPSEGCYNLHASALPRWRGAAPIQRAIMAGDRETAAMVMRMDEGLDTGPVCLAEGVAIGPETTAGELHDRLAATGADLVVRALSALERGSLACTPQTLEGVTYAAKIDKAETKIDLTRPARQVHDHVRGLSPSPGAWLELPIAGRGERVKVLRCTLIEPTGAGAPAPPGTILDDHLTIACGTDDGGGGAIRLLEVQRAGKRPMSADELLRGAPVPAGARAG
jgi:methionyl-tRNA formyltransferase